MPITYQELGERVPSNPNWEKIMATTKYHSTSFDFQLPVYTSGILMNLKHNFQLSRFRTIISLKGFNQIKLVVNVL